jgi:hypothetical protein
MSNGNGDMNPIFLGDGSSSAPSQAFFYETNTGIYHDTTAYPNTAWEVVKKGNKRIRVDDNQTYLYGTVSIDNLIPGSGSTTGDTISLSSGTSTAPSLSFATAPSTGIFYDSVGPNPGLATSVSGTETTKFASGLTVSGVPIMLPDGGATAPALEWNTVPPTGIYRETTAGNVDVVVQGNSAGSFLPSGNFQNNNTIVGSSVSSSVSFLGNPSDTKTAPSYTWTGDTKTGLFHPSSNALSVTLGGTETAQFTANSLTMNGSIGASGTITAPNFNGSATDSKTAPSYSWPADTSTGFYRPNGGAVALSLNGTTHTTFNSLGLTTTILNANSGAFTGIVTQERIYARVYRAAVQNVATFPSSGTISWDTVETVGGGLSNFPVTVPTTTLTIPTNGLYSVTYSVTWASNTAGVRNHSISINGGTRRYAETNVSAVVLGCTSITASFEYKFASSSTIQLNVLQSSGVGLDCSNQNGGNTFTTLSVVYLSE